MYFLNKITLVGGESVYISDKSVYRQIEYNQLKPNGSPLYKLSYEEEYKLEEGLRFRLNLITAEEVTTLYKDEVEDSSNIQEIDTDNLTDFCVNIINSQALPTGMTVTKDMPMEISLYGNDDNLVEFSFIPEKDGIIYHLKDTILYTDHRVQEIKPKEETTVSDLPILYKDNMLVKIVYTNGNIINKDYRNSSEILVFENKVYPVINIKYNTVLEVTKGNYKLHRQIPIYSKIRKKVDTVCRSTDTFTINNYSTGDNNLAIYSATTEKIVFEINESKSIRGNGVLRTYHIIYPSHYVSILGNILIDSSDYKIYTEEEIAVENGKLVTHNIWYHRLDKGTIKGLNKLLYTN